MTVVTRGDREVALRLERFPELARERLEERITQLTDELEGQVEGRAPFRTGKLRSEITQRVFSQDRIAGYVSVYAQQDPGEYAKAATLEYGTNKPRRTAARHGLTARLTLNSRRIEAKLSRAVHIEAFEYLRGPLAEMAPEIRDAFEEVLNDAASEGE